MKRFLTVTAFVVVGLFAGAAVAGGIKYWNNGDNLTAADLNAAFAHIHSLMVGGHGPRLVDADVSSGAALTCSKTTCQSQITAIHQASALLNATSPTTINYQVNVASITHTGTGNYKVTFTAPFATANYVATCSCRYGGADLVCVIGTQSTSQVTVHTLDFAAANADCDFNLVIFNAI